MKTPPGGWPLAIQVSIAVLVTIGLSIWQLGRGFEKLEMKDEFVARLNQPALQESAWQASNSEYRKVELRGRFDPHRFFIIENQTNRGRPGYWIIGVFNTERDRYLVNRGWVPIQSLTQLDPDIETPIESLSIIGIVWPNPVIRAPTSLAEPNWPVRLREVDISQMARLTSARAQELRLIQESPAVLQAAPLQVEFSTAMHWGYAAQWLLIGALVLGGYWFFTIRKDKQDSNT